MMKHARIAIVLTLLFTCWVAAADDIASSGARSALLIGNASYDGAALKGVDKSLDAVQKALEARGFQVTRQENLKEQQQEKAVEAFTRGVPTNGVALIYYAGLAAHVERLGKHYNLLRPLDVSIRNEGDYRSKGVSVGDLIESLRQESGSRVNLIFLDACVESPIKPEDDKVRSGLIAFEAPADTAVMFAAPSGKTITAPGDDAPSALATALARHVEKLDASIQQAFDAIANDAGKPWFAAPMKTGLGAPSTWPVLTGSLREGKTPGEGYVNSIGVTFRWCPPGRFTMGSSDMDKPATRDRKPVEVTLSRGFWMGEHEVTQREYDIVRGRTPPPDFTRHKNAPFWGVGEAKHVTEFCEKLNELEREAGTLPDGWEYACPTEAQWEYACRAGSTGKYSFGDDVSKLGQYANFADAALAKADPNYHYADRRSDDGVGEALAQVGGYRPNAWGLRDMHGNVAEVVADHLTPELPGGTDPLGRLEKDGQTVIRGGAWCSLPLYCESSFRNSLASRDKLNYVGFRIVLKPVK